MYNAYDKKKVDSLLLENIYIFECLEKKRVVLSARKRRESVSRSRAIYGHKMLSITYVCVRERESLKERKIEGEIESIQS